MLSEKKVVVLEHVFFWGGARLLELDGLNSVMI